MRNRNLVCLALGTLFAAGASWPAAAQTCSRPIKIDCLHARPAVMPEARFAYGATASGDAWVARFDKGSSEPVWRTKIAGAGRQSIAAVALRQNGELLVAGDSTSKNLPGFAGQNHGRRDGIVLRLDGKSGRLLGGSFVGGADDDSLTGVAEGASREVLVAGHSATPPKPLGKAPGELTVLVPASASPEAATTLAFVSSLGPAGEAELFRHPLGRLAVKFPRVWIDCWGHIVVGVSFQMAAPCGGAFPDLVYEQEQIAQDYDIDTDWNNPLLGFPPGGFGFHALRWKEYFANSLVSPPFTLDWSLVTSPAVPKDGNPTCTDAADLNTLETQVLLQNGVPVDPLGSWMCGNHTDLGQLSLFAAYLHGKWGTPVYTHFGYWNNLQTPDWTWYTHPAAIERTVFEPYCLWDPNAYQGETLEDLCDLSVNSVDDLTCTTDAGIPGVAGNGYFLKLKYFEGADWGFSTVWSHRPSYWDPDFTWFWEEWYEPGVYLMDPPAGSAHEVAVLAAASRQLSGLVAREGRVVATRFENGRAACSNELKGLMPAGE